MKRNWKVALATLLLLGGAGLAYAYWTTTGSGSGSAGSGDTQAVVIKQTAAVAGMFPGGDAKSLSGNFDNPNPGPVTVDEIDAAITGVTGPNVSADNPCTAGDYELSGFPVEVGGEVPAGTGVGSWSGGSIRMLNTSQNQNGCKDATVAISYSAN